MKNIFLREDCRTEIIPLPGTLLFNLELKGFRKINFKNLSADQIQVVERLKSDAGLNMSNTTLLKSQLSLLKVLHDKKLLVDVQNKDDRTGLFLTHIDPGFGNYLEKLADKKVLILGCGGTGAIIADHLARSGVKNFVLVDGAALDKPDLNRQFPFTRFEIGKNKALLLGNYLKKNFLCRIKTFPLFLDNPKCFERFAEEKFDLIFHCADQPAYQIQIWAMDFAIQVDCPILFGSVGIYDYLLGRCWCLKSQKLSTERLLGTHLNLTRRPGP